MSDPELIKNLSSTEIDELNALTRALSRAEGFRIYFVRTRSEIVRKEILAWLQKKVSRSFEELVFEPKKDLILQLNILAGMVSEGSILSIIGFEKLDEKSTLRNLNWKRAAFQKIDHPIIFWLSEYWLRKIANEAPDFYDWNSGSFEFDLWDEQQPEKSFISTYNAPFIKQKRLGPLSIFFLEIILNKHLADDDIFFLMHTSRESTIVEVVEKVEKRFRKEYSDKDISTALLSGAKIYYPLGSITAAENLFYKSVTSIEIPNFLNQILFDFYPEFAQARIEDAVEFYVKLLTEELALNASDLVINQENILNKNKKIQGKSELNSPHQLPAPSGDFTGRESEIEAILADFTRGHGVSISGLVGMAGIGKTALGLIVANRLKSEYPDAQIFVDLKGTTEPVSSFDVMRKIILVFEPSSDLRAFSENELIAEYHAVLAEKRALVFLDDARNAEQVRALVPPASCGLLVTSRWNFALPGLKTHRLGNLTPNDAGAFLVELCERIGGRAGELAKLCGYLPLALRLAGSFLAVNESVEVSDYQGQLEARRLESLRQAYDESETAEQELAGTFALSYECLDGGQKKAWRELGVFPDSFTGEAAGAVWKMETEEAEKALRLLCRYSLLDAANEGRYRLHDLLGEFAKGYLTEQERFEAERRHASYYAGIPGKADELYEKGNENVLKGLGLLDREWAHVVAGQAWAARNFEVDNEIARLCSQYVKNPYCLNLRLHAREQIKWMEMAVEACRVLKDRSNEGVYLGNLGIAYASLGETGKAIEYYERSLSIDREIGDRGGEGSVLTNLGTAYANLGETGKAIEYYERSLIIDREIGNRRDEGTALGNLGIVYKDLGETGKAIEYYERSLSIDREIGNRRGEGVDLGNLGNAYAILGETGKAIEFYEQALSIAHEIGDRRGEGNALGNLGNVYAELGETGKAIEYYERSLSIDREIGDRGGEGSVLTNLGTAYANLGETGKAIEYYERSLIIDREIGNRRGEGIALGNLGIAYRVLGETEKAIEFYEQQLVIVREIVDRRGEGNALGNLGNAYAELGETGKVIEYYERSLIIFREIGDRRGEGLVLGNLGKVYEKLGEKGKAEECFELKKRIERELEEGNKRPG